MRKALLLILFVTPMLSFSQNREKFITVNPIYEEALSLENGLITYSLVVPTEGVDKEGLYFRSYDWIIKSFNSPKDAVQLSDKDAGKVICRAYTTQSAGKGFFGKVVMNIYYLLTIEVRDERYKITASNFVHQYDESLGVANVKGQNPLEDYFLLKQPTKKEKSMNMEIASNLATYIWMMFESAEAEIKKSKDDDW